MGETILGDSFALGPGGKGSNQSCRRRPRRRDVTFITRLGQDTFADMALATWKGAGVKPAVSQDAGSYTGAAYIFVDSATGDNAIIVAPGAAAAISEADIDAQAALIGGAGVFVTQLEQPLPPPRSARSRSRARGV